MGNQIKIYICYHKPSKIFSSDVFCPIHVGKALSKQKLNMIGDNTGDNISEKNPYFCELTGLYYMWKNVDVDNIGLFHYRRFLNFKNSKGFLLNFPNNFLNKYNIKEDTINNLLNKYDVILPLKSGVNLNVYNHYKRSHIISDLDKCISIINKKYPEMKDICSSFFNGHKMHLYNMFIMKKEIFNEYCNWLFDILFELEKEIQTDVEKRDAVQKRAYGYLAERLFNVYMLYIQNKKNIKIKEVPCLWITGDRKVYLKHRIKEIRRKILKFLGLGKDYW